MGINPRIVIMAMSKSAWPEGRTGDRNEQDWSLVVDEAALLYRDAIRRGKDAILVAVTGFTNATSQYPEIYYYQLKLGGLLLSKHVEYELLAKGIDTTTQLLAAYKFAKERGAELYIISTKLHVMRVRWITWWDKKKGLHNLKIKHFTPSKLGIPRKEEIKNDVILMFLFPIIDILGMRPQFLAYVEKRRGRGKL